MPKDEQEAARLYKLAADQGVARHQGLDKLGAIPALTAFDLLPEIDKRPAIAAM